MKIEKAVVRGIRIWMLATMVTAGVGVRAADAADGAAIRCSTADGSINRVAAFMKRLPNITHEQFKEHYEKVHSLIGEKYLGEARDQVHAQVSDSVS